MPPWHNGTARVSKTRFRKDIQVRFLVAAVGIDPLSSAKLADTRLGSHTGSIPGGGGKK